MDVKQIWLENLKGERRITRETITAMADGDMQFKATPDQMSFGAHALHVISSQETLMDAINGNGWKWERGTTMQYYPAQEAILNHFDYVYANEQALYANMELAQFFRMIPTAWGAPEPLVQLAISFLTHEAHHRGQMITYLWLKEMKPAKY